ncbi:MAG: hypothetical protein HKN25_09045, partial [Pyrinomonadaceae bacterium]|nr:hypothetical protein [Pyrinomonadaceae bacterium]
YRLRTARAMEGGGFFPGKAAGARGVYLSGSKSIVHEISVYRSKDTAKSDFASFKRRVRRDGGKIRSNKSEQIIFSMKKLVYLGFLNPQGGIHLISSRNGNDIITYYNAYFK